MRDGEKEGETDGVRRREYKQAANEALLKRVLDNAADTRARKGNGGRSGHGGEVYTRTQP